MTEEALNVAVERARRAIARDKRAVVVDAMAQLGSDVLALSVLADVAQKLVAEKQAEREAGA